jgi:hypothetical protein
MNDDGKSAGSSPGDRTAGVRSGAQGTGLSDQTQKRIGLHLRTMYDAIVQQPVPDRFRDLIDRLDDADRPS